MRSITKIITAAALAVGALSPVAIVNAEPAQAIVAPDVYNGDNQYSIQVWDRVNAISYVAPLHNSLSKDITKVSFAVNMCYNYIVGGVTRTDCGNVVPSVSLPTGVQLRVLDIWLR